MPESGRDSGLSMRDSFARYDRASQSWRMLRASLWEEDSDAFSGTWPKRGMMRSGVCYRLPGSAPPMSASVYSSLRFRQPSLLDLLTNGLRETAYEDRLFLVTENLPIFLWNKRETRPNRLVSAPTLATGDSFGNARMTKALCGWLDRAEGRTESSSTRINPSWAERYMGFPEGWTGLES